MTKKEGVGLLIFIAALLGVGLVWRSYGGSLSPSSLRIALLQWGFWKGAVLYFLIYTLSIRPFVPIPPTLYTLAGGFVFGPVVGTVLTVLAATSNASITFTIGRYLGKGWVERRLGGKWKRAQEKLVRGGFKTLLLIRISPVGLPFDLVSYAAGMVGIRFVDYLGATLIGILPATAAYSYFGGSLSQGAVKILIAIFGIVFLAVVLPWIWRKRRNSPLWS
ncbi:MAG: TVP38/TMEM64 family protein [Acidobacteria bacterium]|nr:TVP38/TMEM64 family protein [Acidobacteriota bacterium]